MRFIGAPQEHEDNLQYIYKETETVVIASVLWASVLQCIRPLRWLPAYSLEYPKGRLENRAGSLSLREMRLVYLWGPVPPYSCPLKRYSFL